MGLGSRTNAHACYSQTYAKKIVATFKDWEFYTGESMDPDGMIVLLNYRDDGTTPYVDLPQPSGRCGECDECANASGRLWKVDVPWVLGLTRSTAAQMAIVVEQGAYVVGNSVKKRGLARSKKEKKLRRREE